MPRAMTNALSELLPELSPALEPLSLSLLHAAMVKAPTTASAANRRPALMRCGEPTTRAMTIPLS